MRTRCAIQLALIVLTPFAPALGQLGVSISSPQALNANAGSDSGIDEQPDLATDGMGTWLAVWSSTENLGGSIGVDRDVLVSKSTDNGATWTAPKVINSDASSDVGEDFSTKIVTDKAGNWLVVWVSNNDLSDLDVRFSRSTDNGVTWSAFGVLNSTGGSDTGNDEAPKVTTDQAGNWVAMWHSSENVGGTIGTDADILIARSTDNGATWSAATALNANAATDTGNDQYVQPVTDGAGQWVAVWHSTENLGGTIGADADILIARSTDNGVSWTAPTALNDTAVSDTGADEFPHVNTDAAGNWIAVWQSTENLAGTAGADRDVFVSISSDAGATWSAVQTLNSNATSDAGDDFLPVVANVQSNDWLTIWYSSDTLGATIGGDVDILASRTTDGGASWSAPEILNVNAATDTGNDSLATIATDGLHGWVVAWNSTEPLGGTVGGDNDILTTSFALPDCNGNGTGDAFDISSGVSGDCNGNQIPDECDGGCPPSAAGAPCNLQDTDLDGVDNCQDRCPNTPAWATADQTGCACIQLDNDNDGVHDCLDACPDQPDVDADGDHVPDCVDQCADDPNKSDPGICRCGTPDTDTDSDGTPDCTDACPLNPLASDPATCNPTEPEENQPSSPDPSPQPNPSDGDPDRTPNPDDATPLPTAPTEDSRGPCGLGIVGAGFLILLGISGLKGSRQRFTLV